MVLIGLVIAAQHVFAQNKVLTFGEAVKVAMQNSYLLNQQKNNLQVNQMNRTAAYAGLGPTLSLNGGATRVDGNTFNQNAGRVINGVFDQVSGSANANLNIFNGLGQINRVKQSNNLLEAQSYYINRTTQDVLNTVALQYLQVLLDAELLKIANENFAAMQKQLDQVKEQVSLGGRGPVDEYNQDSQTKAAEIRALQAEITLTNDKALLTQTLLLDPREQFDVAKPDWDVNNVGGENYELEKLFETALQSRGDYLRAQKNEAAARHGMNAARASMTPTLSAFGTVYSAYNRAHGDSTVRPFEKQFRQDNLRKVYGLQLYIPVFGGNSNFQNRAAFVQQKIAHANSQILTKNTEIQVKTDVLRAYQNFNLYKRTYTAAVAQFQAAEMAFQLESERYNLGITNFVDFINANRTLVQSQTDKAQAEYRLMFQKVLLDYAVGTLKPEDLE